MKIVDQIPWKKLCFTWLLVLSQASGQDDMMDGTMGGDILDMEPIIPINDDCINATFVSVADGSIIIGSNVGATNDFDPSMRECGVLSGPGVWYTFVGNGTRVVVSTCAESTKIDTSISVFTGSSCSNLACVGSNDDAPVCPFNSGPSTLSWQTEADAVYYVFVQGFASERGTFGLSITELIPPGNDLCQDSVVMVPDGSPFTGSIGGATFEPFCNTEGSQLPGVWFTVQGTGNGLRASTCSEKTSATTALSLYTGSCDMLQCFTGVSFFNSLCTPTAGGSILSWNSVVGVTYYVAVFGTPQGLQTSFDLTLTEFNAPSNDVCTGTTVIDNADGSVIQGSTVNATVDLDVAGSCDVANAPGVWYQVTGKGNRITASTCTAETRASNFDTFLSIFTTTTGGCDGLECMLFSDDDAGCPFGLASTISWVAEVGQVYYILLHGFSLASGSYGLTVTELVRPDNDFCSAAVGPINPNQLVFGTTADALPEAYCLGTGEAPGVWYTALGTGNGFHASTCSSETISATALSVFVGDCEQLVCVGGTTFRDGSCESLKEGGIFSWRTELDVTYYILVSGDATSGNRTFGLSISEFFPPSNDLCVDAEPVVAGQQGDTAVIAGTTVDATVESAFVNTCEVQETPGVWYTLTGNGTRVVFSLCTTDTTFDTVVSVFRGNNCDALECVTFNDDANDCAISSFASSVEWQTVSGETYFILVHAFSPETGSFGLTVTELIPPENDSCESVTSPLPTNDTVVVGTADGATLEPFCSDESLEFPGVWYTTIGTGTALRATTCTSATSSATRLSVFVGSCSELVCVQGATTLDTPCPFFGGSSISWDSELGVTYYIVVSGDFSPANETFGISVAEFEPPENDDCLSATGVPPTGFGSTLAGSTTSATFDFDFDANRTGFCGVSSSPGVWYTVAGTGSLLMASTCSPLTTFDTTLSVFTGDCGSLECVGFSNEGRCFFNPSFSTITWDSVEGEMYSILVHGNSERGDFGLIVEEVVIPVNDLCTGAIGPLQPNGNATIGSVDNAAVEPFCDMPGFSNPAVWYTVLGTGFGLTASTCNAAATAFTALSIYIGECGSLQCIADSTGEAPCNGFEGSTVSWLSEPGVTYSIAVYGDFLPTPEIFALNITGFDAPSNDVCSSALSLSDTSGTLVTGSTLNATVDFPPDDFGDIFTCGVPITAPGVWYTAIGTGLPFSVSTCANETDYDTAVSVFRGNCTDLGCIGGNNDGSGCPFGSLSSSLTFETVPGEMYQILVHGSSFNVGNFGLKVMEIGLLENDVCDAAIGPLEVDGSVVVASAGGARMTNISNCDDPPSTSPGVWYTVSGTGGVLRASTCSEETNVPTIVSVFMGGCGNLTCVEEVTSGTSCDSPDGFIAEWVSVFNVTYQILVQEGAGSVGGIFGLSISELPTPTNNLCEEAIGPLKTTSDSFIRGTTIGATREIEGTCGVPVVAPGVWYSVLGTGVRVIASTCSNVTNYNTAISVFAGSCDGLACVGGSANDTECFSSNSSSSFTWFATVGETYFIHVHGATAESAGDFRLIFEEMIPPDNDSCSGAVPIPKNETVVGSTELATIDEVDVDKCGVSIVARGVWLSVTGTGNLFTLTTCTSETNFATALTVYSGSCNRLECVEGVGSDVFCESGFGSTVSWLADEDVEYLILVHGNTASDMGTFGIQLQEIDISRDNDSCVQAIGPLAVDGRTILGSTVDATVDSDEVFFCGLTIVSPGVWFSVVGTGSEMTVSTCTKETRYDTALSVFSGECGNLVCVGGNDDDRRCDFASFWSTVRWDSIAGVRYYILVHGFSALTTGTFGMTISAEVTPPNDFCDDAIGPLTPSDAVVIGSTQMANRDNAPLCGVSNSAPGVWYVVNGTGNVLTATTCTGRTDFDTRISVFAGSCMMLECIVGDDDSGCGTSSRVEWESMPGEEYYILVHGFGGANGNFGLVFEEIITAENDECVNAILLGNDGTVFSGTTADATVDTVLDPGTIVAQPCQQPTAPGVWFVVNGTGSTLAASTCTEETTFDTVLSVFTGNCSSLDCVAESDDNDSCEVSSLSSIVTWDSVAGQEYFILLHGFMDSTGEFGVSVFDAV